MTPAPDDVVDRDERLASAAGLVDDAAAAGRGLVERRIARGEEGHAFVDEEGDAAAQLERPAEEGVVRPIEAQGHGMAFGAAIDGLLNAHGVELRFVGGGESAGARGEMSVERGADRRQNRFGDGAGVLRGSEWDRREQNNTEREKEPLHV